jgi:putative transposase
VAAGFADDAVMDDETKTAIALFRYGVLGPLVSARLEHGDRRAYFEEAAARRHVTPDGREITLSPRTIEAWFYAYAHGGLASLRPSSRSDVGKSRAIDDTLADVIRRAKLEKPRRSVVRIIKMLERAGLAAKGALSKASVHRVLKAAGISSRPVRGPSCERRSFIAAHAGDLCVGDALHPRSLVIAPDGKLKKAILFSEIDNATRFITHSFFVLASGEDSADHERGLKASIEKFGLPRAFYVDHGPAYIAKSLLAICAELKIELRHAGKGDAEAKGCIERWHRTWREEVEDELGDEPIPYAELQAKHWAWLGAEYHARKHTTTSRVPREHFLADAHELRPVPRSKNLDEVFLHRARRKVRKDGTVRWGGGYLEVRPELVGDKVELRYDPNDASARPRVFVDNKFFCDTVPLDRKANMHRKRRRMTGAPVPQTTPTGLDPLGLIEDEHYRKGRFERRPLDDDDDDTED